MSEAHNHEWGETGVCECKLTRDGYNRLHGYEGYPHPHREDDLEVIWSGRGLLLPPRETKPDGMWKPPKRIWNRGKHVEVQVRGLHVNMPSSEGVKETV